MKSLVSDTESTASDYDGSMRGMPYNSFTSEDGSGTSLNGEGFTTSLNTNGYRKDSD